MAALPRFVVQLHDATTLHFDFRLQAGDVLRSWAVPRGPSLDPAVRRLAVPVEDHTLAAGEFEGVHEGQVRGSGAVIIWDEGTAEMVRDEPGHVSFVLHGRKLSGGFALTRTGERRWILVKVRDEAARPGSDIVTERPASVRSGRTWQELRHQPQAGQPYGARQNRVRANRHSGRFAALYGVFNHLETFSCRKSRTRQAESEHYLNMVPGGFTGPGGKYPPSG